MPSLTADVCVIGTGAGGAPVAAELAAAGARVVVLEEGDEVATAQLTGRPGEMLPRVYRDAGQFATVGTPPIVLPLGRAVGGTTLVNSGTCLRAAAAVRSGWGEDLDPHYDEVERRLRVAPADPAVAGRNAHLARRAAEALGWSGGWLPRNAHGCRGTGVCAWGCPRAAKQHTGVSWIPAARGHGAEVRPNTRATRIELRRGRARAVHAVSGGRRLTVHADRVVVAAGTIHTPGLLARSGIDSPHLGRHLTVHPATACWALMDEEVDMARGVPQSFYVDEFAGEGILLEGIAGPPEYLAMAIPFAGERHRRVMLEHRRVAQFGLMVSDTTEGRVVTGRALRRPLVRYDVDARGAERVRRGVERLAELFRAAGARTLFTPIARALELPGADPAPLRRLRADPRELKLMAFHPLGTARMAGRPQDGVADLDGRVHGTRNLYVCDGSAVPVALGVNPQLTIMALAVRLARHLATTT